MPIDVKIFYFFNNLAGKSAIFDASIIFLADYFGYFVVAAFFTLLFLAPFYKDKSRVFLTAVISVVLSRFTITEIIRFSYCRSRPFAAHIVKQLVETNHCSFPSGHAALFFALAMAIYFYNKKWGAWFFSAAVLMGLARIIAGVHYPLDILGGAAVGILSAYAIFYFAKKINYV